MISWQWFGSHFHFPHQQLVCNNVIVYTVGIYGDIFPRYTMIFAGVRKIENETTIKILQLGGFPSENFRFIA